MENFKVGDRVKIEGVLEESGSFNSPLKLNCGDYSIIMNNKGQVRQVRCETYEDKVAIQLVERPKTKVKKYKVLYKFHNSLFVSDAYYKNITDFSTNDQIEALQLLEATEKEFEEWKLQIN